MKTAPAIPARTHILILVVVMAFLFAATPARAAGIAASSPIEGQVVSEGATMQFSFRKDGDWTVATAPNSVSVQVTGVQTNEPLTLTPSIDDPRLYVSNPVVVTCSTSSPCRQLPSLDASAFFMATCSASCGGTTTATATAHFTFLPTPPPITVQFQPGMIKQGGSTRIGVQVTPGQVGAREVVATWLREGVVASTTTIPLSSSTFVAVNGWSPSNMQAGRWRIAVTDAHTGESLYSSDFVVAPPDLSILFSPRNLMVGLLAYTDLAIATGQTGDRAVEVTWLHNGTPVAGGVRSHAIKQSAAFYTRDAIRPTKPGTWKLLVTDWTGTIYARTFTVSPKIAAPRLGATTLSNTTRRGRLRQIVRVRICAPAGAITTRIDGTYKLGSRVISRKAFTFSGSHKGGCRLWTYSWNVPQSWLGVGRRTFRVQTTDRFGQKSNATTASFTVAD